jgi:hypothetical protein
MKLLLGYPGSGLQAVMLGWGLLLIGLAGILGLLQRVRPGSMYVAGNPNRWLDQYVNSRSALIVTVIVGIALIIGSIVIPALSL